jgi:hypothetical protein
MSGGDGADSEAGGVNHVTALHSDRLDAIG